MPSNKPKVFAYLPQTLYDQVEVFKTERGLNSDSQALIAILSEYFGSEIIDHAKSNNAIERLEILLNQYQIKAESSIQECDRRISALEVRYLETGTNPTYTIEASAKAIKETIDSKLLNSKLSFKLNELQNKYKWSDGFCRAKLTSGTIVSGWIVSYQPRLKTCKMFNPHTDSHWSVILSELQLPNESVSE